jgi:hypothetical protein
MKGQSSDENKGRKKVKESAGLDRLYGNRAQFRHRQYPTNDNVSHVSYCADFSTMYASLHGTYNILLKSKFDP